MLNHTKQLPNHSYLSSNNTKNMKLRNKALIYSYTIKTIFNA